MQAEGVDPLDPDQLYRFSLEAERRFMQRTTRAIRAKRADAAIFYNSRLRVEWDEEMGNRPELDDFTHLEIESLPGRGSGATATSRSMYATFRLITAR